MKGLCPTAAMEESLIELIKNQFTGEIKTVESIGGAWTDATLRTLLKVAPAIYIAFIGNSLSEIPDCVQQTWGVFLSVKVLNGNRVDPQKAFAIHDYLIALLNNRLFDCASQAMKFTQSANLFSDMAAKNGLFVYGLYFSVAMPIPSELEAFGEETGIDRFITYYHKWATTPEWESLNTLPQDENND